MDEPIIIKPTDLTPVVGSEEQETPINSQVSVVDLLRKDYQDIQKNVDVYIPVPGYESTGLSIKYRLPTSGKELDDIVNKVFRETKDTYHRGVLTAIDSMIKLCLGLYVQLPDMEERAELDPDGRGEAVRFNNRLPSILKWKLPEGEDWSARKEVRKLFDGNELAIGQHSARLQQWLAGSKADADSELWSSLGEFPAVR